MQQLGSPGYRSQCLRYLFPIPSLGSVKTASESCCRVVIVASVASAKTFSVNLRNGLVPYAMYCDCWQSVLSDMIGPYRQRRSRLVTFVDPERLDATGQEL